jgi:hypothetical protein
MEAIVGFLIPPACREHVLGDLHERYSGRLQYALEAACTVPLVILSRIRRTTDPQVLLMEGFAIYGSFLVAAWWLQQVQFLEQQEGFLRLVIPTAVMLLALMLRDAYATGAKGRPLQPIFEAALGVSFGFLSQATLSIGNPDLTVPRWIMIYGALLSLLLVSTLRFSFPPDQNRPRGAT